MEIKLCKQGHAKTPDNVYKDGRCRICVRAKNAKWAKSNPEKKRAVDARRDRAKVRAYQQEWVARNKEKQLEHQRAWYARNKISEKERHSKNKLLHPEKIAHANRMWRQKNKPKTQACTRKYQAAKLQRTPKWLTLGQLRDIEVFYMLAVELTKETGVRHEVDHVVPLQGEKVSGLHVPWNLQVLTKTENRSKTNRFTVGVGAYA